MKITTRVRAALGHLHEDVALPGMALVLIVSAAAGVGFVLVLIGAVGWFGSGRTSG